MMQESIIGGQLADGKLETSGIAANADALWVLHTSRRLQSPKVRAFVEFMCSQYPEGSFTIPTK